MHTSIGTILGLLLLTGTAVAGAEPIRPDFAMDSDPVLTLPEPVVASSERYAPLWIEALDSPEADLQRLAAETISRGHEFGIPGLEDARPGLREVLAAEGTHSTARFAAARALIILDSRDDALSLFEASKRHDGSLRQLIETALADWKFVPAIEVWRERLRDDTVRYRDLLLAIRGLQGAGDPASVSALLGIVHDPYRAVGARLAAARAAGALSQDGLEEDARRLLDATAPAVLPRQCAVLLLAGHSGVIAEELLVRLAQDTEPSIAAPALARLNAIDHDLVLPLVDEALRNADPKVREEALAAYVARPTVMRTLIVAGLLDDAHPQVRGRVGGELLRLAQSPDLDGPIRQAATEVLAADVWGGQEQAALLLGALDHKPAAQRLVALLDSPRAEVTVAAAWALRKLAVPETLPGMLDRATRQTDRRQSNRVSPFDDAQVAHLCEAFGLMKYAPAEPMMRRYIPKDYRMGVLSRGGAIWGLGHLHAGKTDEPLAKLLVERLTDPDPPPPNQPLEMMRVRVMSAVSIARMGSTAHLERMRRFLGPRTKPIPSSQAIRYAFRQLTGEVLPEPDPALLVRTGWFLEPLNYDPPKWP